MSDTPEETPEQAAKRRRWFVVLAIVTLIGFGLFVAAITILAVRIPELKKPRYGVLQMNGERRA
jgi:hypothetical protein